MLRPLLRVDVTVIPYPCSSSGTSYGSLLAEALPAAVRAPTQFGPVISGAWYIKAAMVT